jgi:hypothetical protein
MTGIEKAIEAAGGQAALGDMLGVTQQAVGRMKKRGYVPLDRVDQIVNTFRIARSELVDPRMVEALK